MDNFGLLNKNELSYILNNDKMFGDKLVGQIEEYCQRKKYSINIIKAKKAEWKEDTKRLNFNFVNQEIIISKTDQAKRDDNFKFNFMVIAIGLIFFGMIWMIFTKEKKSNDFWFSLAFIPISSLMLFEVYKQRKNAKQKNQQNRELRILKNSKFQLIENGKMLNEKEINTINVFWEDDNEAGSSPKAKLELKGDNGIVVLIDEEGSYLELLRYGNEISKFLNKKLNIFWGEISFKGKIEL